jgi:Flp pilus assembly protein TadD
LHARLARAEFDAGNSDRALDIARHSVRIGADDNALGLEMLVRCLPALLCRELDASARKRILDELHDHARQLAALDDENRVALKALATAGLQRGRSDEAVGWLLRLQKARPADPFAARELGRIYFERKQLDLALPELLEAARTAEHDAELPYCIARIYDQRESRRQAHDWYVRTLQVDPFSEGAHERLAELHLLAGRTKEAVAQFRVLCRLAPQNAHYHARCALAYHKLGDQANARRFAGQAVELDPNSPASVLLEN